MRIIKKTLFGSQPSLEKNSDLKELTFKEQRASDTSKRLEERTQSLEYKESKNTEEQLEQPELVKKTDYLYGIPFFHEETWWIFQSVSSEYTIECDKPCGFSWQDFATLVEIGNNEEFNSW